MSIFSLYYNLFPFHEKEIRNKDYFSVYVIFVGANMYTHPLRHVIQVANYCGLSRDVREYTCRRHQGMYWPMYLSGMAPFYVYCESPATRFPVCFYPASFEDMNMIIFCDSRANSENVRKQVNIACKEKSITSLFIQKMHLKKAVEWFDRNIVVTKEGDQ